MVGAHTHEQRTHQRAVLEVEGSRGFAFNRGHHPRFARHRVQAGHGAGRETDLNRDGNASALASDRDQQKLGGTANEQGESETTNLSTFNPPPEHAGAASQANFHAYETLSRQAVADENLPLAHRQTIKRYFESIRPDGADKP